MLLVRSGTAPDSFRLPACCAGRSVPVVADRQRRRWNECGSGDTTVASVVAERCAPECRGPLGVVAVDDDLGDTHHHAPSVPPRRRAQPGTCDPQPVSGRQELLGRARRPPHRTPSMTGAARDLAIRSCGPPRPGRGGAGDRAMRSERGARCSRRETTAMPCRPGGRRRARARRSPPSAPPQGRGRGRR